MAQYIYKSNDQYRYLLDQSTGFRFRIGVRNHFIVRDKELYENGFDDAEDTGWEYIGGYGDPGDEIVTGGRYRFGVRDCDWHDDIELTATGFDGTEDTDWKCVGSINYNWTISKPSNLVAVVYSDTRIDITWDDGSAGTDGLKIYVNDVYNQTVAFGVEAASITGLTANTAYTIDLMAFKGGTNGPEITTSATTFHSEIGTFITGLVTPLSSAQKIDLNNLVSYWKTGWGVSSLSEVMDGLFIDAGATEESSVKNIVSNNYHGVLVNAPAFTQYEGFTGNTSTRYIRHNYNPTNNGVRFTRNNASLFALYRTDHGTNAGKSFGADNTVADTRVYTHRLANSISIKLNDINQFVVATVDDTAKGLNGATRYASNSRKGFRDKTLSANSTTASTGLINLELYFLAANVEGAATGFSEVQQALHGFGASLDQTQLDVLYDGFAAYMTAKGKTVIT